MQRSKRLLIGLTRDHIVDRIEVEQPTIFLTFDDGPHPVHTMHLLDLLRESAASASFFLIGKHADAHPEVVRAIVGGGHALGNHSYTHAKRKTMSYAQLREGISKTDAVLGRFDGHERHLFRPPWGDLSPLQYLRCLAGVDKVVLWSRDSMDYRDSAESIIDSFRREPPVSGDIILFHDDSDKAVRVLAQLIPEWRKNGFQFASLPQS